MTAAPGPVPPAPGRLDELAALLADLGAAIRDRVRGHRDARGVEELGQVVGRVEADVTYDVDRVGESAVVGWLAAHWPADEPLRLVMEGIEDDEVVTVPAGADPAAVRWVCVVDPVDGTRNLVHDKRAAWVLAALAPAVGAAGGRPRLTDVLVAAMTEIPTVKQGLADQVTARRGGGRAGVVARRLDLRTGEVAPLDLAPSTATGFEHGFCSFSHFLPDGKAALAAIEQHLWDALVPPGAAPRQVFEDQYLCSAGQLYEVASGRDRLVGDLRPLVAGPGAGGAAALSAHPYDVCTALVLTELGGVFEDPRGGPVDVVLDTTSPVAYVAYANEELAAAVRPALGAAIDAVLGGRAG